ncbi:hypothetical protein DH2020_040348 [Rehmannia glutinosa]|uniref:HD-Zip IV C-terminal domain-containing protein n=1 Tax=Rehmannia glutinosa TaxID=99300 RepID=A0ABR0UUE2_REHGL
MDVAYGGEHRAQNERADNNALRAENERIHCENIAMQEALRNIICPTCHGSGLEDEEKQHSLHRLRMENTLLKEENKWKDLFPTIITKARTIEVLDTGSFRDSLHLVTWIEHVQVDDKSLNHRLYRDLVCGCQAYGAKRWIATLQRMCERFAFSMGLTTAPKHELEGGRRNLMRLSHKMVKNFCEVLSMSDKLDFPHLSELNNSGVRVSLRKSNGPGQPDGLIVNAATSLWLPFSIESLFKFFRDEKKRAQDILSSGNPVNAIAHISTGIDPGNCISIIQRPFVPKESMLLLESRLTPRAIIVYAPMDLPTITSVVNGEDTLKIPILPSGYIISRDGRTNKGTGASSSSKQSGSLLTVAFQILVCCSSLSKQLNMESVATVHTLISSTIQKIKVALNCSDLD